MEHLRIAPDIDSDPDLMDAGWCGTRVYELLLKVSAARDLRGRIPPKFQRKAWLLDFWKAKPELPGLDHGAILDHGLERLLAVGQVWRDGEDLILGGWDKFYKRPKTNAERQEDFRNRHCNENNESNGGNENNESNATPHHSTPPTPHHLDQTPIPPSGAPAAAPPEGGLEAGGGEQLRLVPPEAAGPTDVDLVMAYYLEAMHANGKRSRDSPKSRKLIERRLHDGLSVEDCKRAIDGLTWSDFHMKNGYHHLRYALRSEEQAEMISARAR